MRVMFFLTGFIKTPLYYLHDSEREAAVCVCAVRDRDERQGEEVKDEGGKLKEPFAVSLFNLTIASKLETFVS